ncbi:MAG: response regulator [Candidatus Hydrogenedentota bacterium]
MLHYIRVILTATAVLMILLFFTNSDTPTRTVTAVLLPCSVIGYALSYRGNIDFLRITIPILFWLAASTLIYSGLGLHSVSVPSLPLVVLIAALLGGRHASLSYAALSAVTLAGVWFAEQQGLISNGKEGIALYEEHRDSISLLLTDIVMPELGGYELMQLIHRLDPAMSVMLTSGYSADKDLADRVATGEIKLLQKPYRPASLLHIVREELDAAIR